jgi:hypothetical protein
MQAILKFNLPEEAKEHLACTNGVKLASILHNINERIRKQYVKYLDLSDEELAIAEKIFADITDEIDIDLEELI